MESYKQIIVDYINNNTDRILSLLDRNKYSATYGCFDREYWHYKSRAFFNGMYQCYVLSLTLLYKTNFTGNRFFQNQNLKELIVGALNYSIKKIHKDGSFDEHYLNEHSIVATSFSLYCISESIILLNLKIDKYINYLKSSANYLIQNKEKYVRSNHNACIVLALFNTYVLTNLEIYKTKSMEFLNFLLENRSKEGWFTEYNGCDLGYLTFTVDFLCKFAFKSNNNELLKILTESIKFCSHFMHSDGIFGGFYGSRDNMHFLPYSFETIKLEDDTGKKMVNSYLIALKHGISEMMNDDHFMFLTYNNLLELYQVFDDNRPEADFNNDNASKFFEEAGIYVFKRDEYYGIISLKKGGIIYIYRNKELVFKNCGLIALTNKAFITTTGFKNVEYQVLPEEITIKSQFKVYNKPKIINNSLYLLLNIYNLSLGRIKIFRQLLKTFLLRTLILNEKLVKIDFKIEIKFLKKIKLRITINKKKNIEFYKLRISSFLPRIYVPSGEFFQINELLISEKYFENEKKILNKTNNTEILIDI